MPEATTISATTAADNPRGSIVVNKPLFASKISLRIELRSTAIYLTKSSKRDIATPARIRPC